MSPSLIIADIYCPKTGMRSFLWNSEIRRGCQLSFFTGDREADAVEQAVKQVLKDGYRTIDIMPQEKQQEKVTQVGTAQMGDLICERIR